MIRTRLSRGIAIVPSLCALAAAGQTTTFDNDLEGWTVYADGAIVYDAAVGNPAGSARASDFGSGSYFGFQAPASYLGDKSASYGGTLTFDIMTNNATTAGATQPDVLIQGGGLEINLDLPVPTADVWNQREVALDTSSDWRLNSLGGAAATEEQIQTVLSNVTLLRIRGEFSTMTSDVTHLDNVSFPDTPDCLADVNNDGMLSPTDFTAWVGAFNSNAPECDQNNDGMCTPTDFTAWVGNYNAGCP